MKSVNKRNFLLLLASAICLLTIVYISGCGRDSELTAKNRSSFRSDTVNVKVSEISIRDFERSYRATGTLEAKQKAMLRTIVGGLISEIPVDIGDRVKKGDLLMQIREIDYELALEQAEADLARAEAQLEQANRERDRTVRLYENGTASEQDLDHAITSFNEMNAVKLQAEAARNKAMQNLEDASIRAPYDGVITERLFEPGEFAPSAEAAIEILNLGTLEANLEVPEKYIGLIDAGSDVLLNFESNFLPRTGKIVAVSPKVSSATRSFRVRIQVKNDDLSLPSGQFFSTMLDFNKISNQLTIPQNALVREDGNNFVWMYDQGIAVKKNVRIGLQDNDWIVVKDGINYGDLVITDGKSNLNEHYPVKILP